MSNVFAALSHTLSRPLTPSTSPFTHLHPSHPHHHHQACRMSLPAAVRPRNARCALSCSLGLQMSACSLSGHTHSLFHPPSFTPSLFHTHTPSNTPPHPLTHPLYPPLSLASTVTQVQLEVMSSGLLILTNKALYYHPQGVVGGLAPRSKPLKDRRW